MKVRTRPVTMEAHPVKAICAWYQRRQLQGMPEGIVKAHRDGRLQFMGDRIRIRAHDGNEMAEWDDVIVIHPKGQLERLPLHIFHTRYDVVPE